MLTTEFSKSTLGSIVRLKDVPYYPFLRVGHQKKSYLSIISKRIENGTFVFNRLVEKNIRGFKAYRTNKLGDELVLRRLSEIIKRVYKLKQGDRSDIVKQISTLLGETHPKYILRLDIASFFEKVNRDLILQKLKNDNLVSQYSLSLLQKFFFSLEKAKVQGLPRGMGISAVLSELYLFELDKEIRRIEGVYYYARYVDDIIIFSTNYPISLKEKISTFLPQGLIFNERKSKEYYVMCKCKEECICAPNACNCKEKCKCKEDSTKKIILDYVGYELTFSSVPTTKDDTEMKVNLVMSERKVNRYKTKIVLAFLSYMQSHNYGLLKDRLAFLAENHRLRRSGSKGKLMTGIYYNYHLVSDPQSFKPLDTYLRNIIYGSSSSFASKVKASLTIYQRSELAKISFVSGFKSRRRIKISSSIVKVLRRCWKYV